MQENDERLSDLERRADIELEKLGVAEDLGWAIAALAAAVTYFRWGGWMLPVLIFVGAYYLVTFSYRRREVAATNAYQRASRTGKYYVPPSKL